MSHSTAKDHIIDLPLRRAEVPSRLTYWATLVVMVMALFVGLASFAMRPSDAGAFAVIVHPKAGPERLMNTLAIADGVLVRESRYPWLAIVAPRHDRSEKTFRSQLLNAGALLTLHPALLAGCFSEPLSPPTV